MSLSKGIFIRITPSGPQTCSSSTPWRAQVLENERLGMYPIAFDSKVCPPAESTTKQALMYWLQPGQPWRILPALAALPYNVYQSHAISVQSIGIEQPDNTLKYVDMVSSVSDRRSIGEMAVVTATLNNPYQVSVPLKDVINKNDIKDAQRAMQQTLLNKFKPRLVRSVAGGRNDGLGIRDPDASEYRKEYLKLAPNAWITFQVIVTDHDGRLITEIVIHGKILQRYEGSALINGLGVVYEVDPETAIGDPVDIESYAPVFIGRRKLKYWLCVYYDLNDNKVVVSASTLNHAEAVLDMGMGGRGNSRLAEYAVGEIKLSTPDRTEKPYIGDKEDTELKKVVSAAQNISLPVPTVPQIATTNLIQAPVLPALNTEQAVQQPSLPEPEPLPRTRAAQRPNPLGLRRVAGGGLEVPDKVKQMAKV